MFHRVLTTTTQCIDGFYNELKTMTMSLRTYDDFWGVYVDIGRVFYASKTHHDPSDAEQGKL